MKSHKCSICDNTSSKKENLKRHIQSLHEEQTHHKCSLCDYARSGKLNLDRHIQSVHEGKKPHKCTICDYIIYFLLITCHYSISLISGTFTHLQSEFWRGNVEDFTIV